MKRVAQRIGMLVGGLLVGLILAEIACKIIDLGTASARQMTIRKISRLSLDPNIRYELIPGVEARTPGQRHTVRVNNLGFRGKDLTRAKPEGTFRIAVLGDSIAFGRTYADEEVFPAVLETLLNRDVRGTRFEVINASLSGRDTWEEAAVLERDVLPLDPDIIILQICLNDHVRLPKPDSSDVGAFGELPWYGYSSLLRLLDLRVRGFRETHVACLDRLGIDNRTPNEVLRDQVVRPAQMLEVDAHWEAWRDELLRIAALSRAHGATILFVAFPIDIEIRHGDKETLPQLSELAAAHGIPLLDMLPFFQDRPEAMLRDYTHPSLKGHYVSAREIAALVRAYLASEG